jgi:hypothetical protein
MAETKVVIVHLRRPGKKDKRSDPFWEFGSFGITRCHASNLLNPKRVSELEGRRLAFAQGGKRGTRLVFLTAPIHKAIPYKDRSEVLWNPHLMPFRYESAPLLIDNSAGSDFPLLRGSFKNVSRTTWVGKFASKFRSRREPLENAEARELISRYYSHRKKYGQKSIAKNYVDALPRHSAPLSSAQREKKYEKYCEKAGRAMTSPRSCCGRQKLSNMQKRNPCDS